MPQYFAIIGSNDRPLYETEFHKDNKDIPQSLKELNPFILHASLDIIEDLQWQIQPNDRSMFFGQDDSYNNDGVGVGMSIFKNSLGAGSDSNGMSSLTAGFLRSSSTNSYNNNDKNSTGAMNNIISSSSNSNIQQILKNDNCYLSRVDHFYGHVVTAYITYSGLKFVMVHCNTDGMIKDNTSSIEKGNDGTNTDNINKDDFIFMGNGLVIIDDNKCKKFYQEIHELYVKTLLNPFYKLGQPINDPEFNIRVHSIAQKYLQT
ncbi:TRAPP subunit TRS20 PWA37_005322 [Arxiozyma heterogenica]|uniref:Sedlin n=1 Tax=Arxiozyma heterogenica TaxID=278026 RepID=A0AAN7WJU2_9SACH|nr:hypothetical protein RI543_000253 [Kazachstania heterogenica]